MSSPDSFVTMVDTPYGIARITAHPAAGQASERTVVIFHGAGTDTNTPLLVGLAEYLASSGVAAWRLDQPYALGPRRPPPPAAALDAVATTVVTSLEGKGGLYLIGRSSGSRVACRIARDVGAAAVVALGFPLQPRGRRMDRVGAPEQAGAGVPVSRAGELRAAGVPVTVLQGSRDAFGGPVEIAALGLDHVTVASIEAADHAFAVRRKDGRSTAGVHQEVIAGVLSVVLGRAALER